MSFEPFTMYRLRCDGQTTRGQCDEIYRFHPDDDPENGLVDHIQENPALAEQTKRDLRHDGWMATGHRVLCPRHVHAAEHLVAASMDGLPFEDGQ